MWTRQDYVTLINAAMSGRFQVEHWQQFCTIESDQNPAAQSKYAPAKGLWQALPSILTNLGWTGGDFCQAPISTQISYSLKYLNEWRNRYGFPSWDRAGDLYLCNFTPAYLPHKDAPDFVIFDHAKDPEYYWVNRGLDRAQIGYPSIVIKAPPKHAADPDYRGKGLINVRDMTLATTAASGHGVYKSAMLEVNKLLQDGLNRYGFGTGLNLKGAGGLVVDGLLGAYSKQALALFWKDHGVVNPTLDTWTRYTQL